MSFTGNVEADASGLGSILASLKLSIDRSNDYERKRLTQAAKRSAYPAMVRDVQQAVANAAGIAVLNFGGPDQGHFWEVAQYTVGGVTSTTVAAGRCDVFIDAADFNGPSMSSLNIGLTAWRDYSLVLPNLAFYGRGQMVLRAPEEVTIIVSGGTAGQQYVGVLRALDFQEAANAQVWDV